MSLCRADKLLLTGGAAVIGSSAVFDPTMLAAGVPAAAVLALLTDGIFRPSSGALYPTISHGPRDQPRVALTFDDGPHPQTTPAVLDVLREHAAHATFFVIGRHLEHSLRIGERMLREGHELGNHSWSHSYFQNFYGRRRYGNDIERGAAIINRLTGSDGQPLFRPPVGLKSPGLARAAHARRLQIIAWSLHTRDTYSSNPEAVAHRTLSRIKPGDIVLLHDGHEREGARRDAALRALPLILRGLSERGLGCVTVTELLAPQSQPAPIR